MQEQGDADANREPVGVWLPLCHSGIVTILPHKSQRYETVGSPLNLTSFVSRGCSQGTGFGIGIAKRRSFGERRDKRGDQRRERAMTRRFKVLSDYQ